MKVDLNWGGRQAGSVSQVIYLQSAIQALLPLHYIYGGVYALVLTGTNILFHRYLWND